MRASRLEFQLRAGILVAIVAIGFWAPWGGARTPLLEWLALQISRTSLLSFTAATPAVVLLACGIAGVAAWLRVWGTAWLGPEIVNNLEMHVGKILAAGPYRYVRNPLYLATWFMIDAVSFVMPVTGALFTVTLITLFLLRLILAEEFFLANRMPESFEKYRRAVPRLIPHLRTNVPVLQGKPHWMLAFLAETNGIGVFLIFAVLAWRYENRLMIKAIVINYGISLVLRAIIVPKRARLAGSE